MDGNWLTGLFAAIFSDEVFGVLAVIATWGFFISGLDDLFIDLRYTIAAVFSRKPDRIRMSLADKHPQKPIAVMVPAWQEANVIQQMLMRNIANIDYLNYHLFVGTYPNDQATQDAVDRAIEFYRRMRFNGKENGKARVHKAPIDFIHKVVTARPGPTNKADNLNCVFDHIKKVERALLDKGHLSQPFEIFVMHDSEDVIHPKEFKVFNYLISDLPERDRPRNETFCEQFDFVQLPVFPLEVSIIPTREQRLKQIEALERFSKGGISVKIKETPVVMYETMRAVSTYFTNVWRYCVSATYMDEFAEHHTKDMVVRRAIRGLVPSAGTGTAMNRRSLLKLEEMNPKKAIFNDIHLTEDYEISLALKNLGAKQFFLVEPVRMEKYRGGRMDLITEEDEFVATKEYFPDSFQKAIRQKSRWVMGITFQTMFPGKSKNLLVDFMKGWEGNMVTKYTLLRDRKSLVTNYINMLGYIVFIYCVARLFMVEVYDDDWSFSNIFPPNSVLWWLLLFNIVVMVERYLQRYHAISKIYGVKQAVYFLIRSITLIGLFLGNFINFVSTLSATKRYFSYVWQALLDRLFPKRKTQTVVRKTAEGTEETVVTRKSTEPAWGKTDHSYLSDDQMREYVNRIGQLAMRTRLMQVEELEEALRRQREEHKRLGEILKNMGIVDDVGFSMLYAQQLSVPMHEIDFFQVDPEVLKQVPESVASEFGLVPLFIDDGGNLIVAVSEPIHEDNRRRIEQRLGRPVKFVITFQSDIEFSRQRAYGHMVQRQAAQIPKLGILLLGQGAVTEKQLGEALKLQREQRQPLGRILVQMGAVDKDVLAQALFKQKQYRLTLGESLMEKGRINYDQLQQALYQQKINRKPLGEILLEMKAVDERDLDEFFRATLNIGYRDIRPDEIDFEVQQRFSPAFCRIYRTIPICQQDDGKTVTFALATTAVRGAIASLEERMGFTAEVFLAPEASIRKAIETCFEKMDVVTQQAQLLGNRLVAEGVIDEHILQEALKQHREEGSRLGEVLVNYGYCDEESFLEVYSGVLQLPVIELHRDEVDPSACADIHVYGGGQPNRCARGAGW